MCEDSEVLGTGFNDWVLEIWLVTHCCPRQQQTCSALLLNASSLMQLMKHAVMKMKRKRDRLCISEPVIHDVHRVARSGHSYQTRTITCGAQSHLDLQVSSAGISKGQTKSFNILCHQGASAGFLQWLKPNMWCHQGIGWFSTMAETNCSHCRMQLGQKLCYRPVFNVETLLTPPPDPFNLNPPPQLKVRAAPAAMAYIFSHCLCSAVTLSS